MSARIINALIRSKKHSITRDKRSNDTICILHGKRADNNDMWSESFSLEEAKKAGLYRSNGPWATFTRDMLFARALSRLARQLFPDIIGNCYVEGEISLDPNIKDNSVTKVDFVSEKITQEEADELEAFFVEIPEYKEEISKFLKLRSIKTIADMPKEMYEKVLKRSKEKIVEKTQTKEAVNA